MDPEGNLSEQIRICERISRGEAREGDTDRLAELVLALHDWLTGGGFLPLRWRPSEDRRLAAVVLAAVKLDRQADSGHESEAHEKFRQVIEGHVKRAR